MLHLKYEFKLFIENELLAPTLMSVRKKTLSDDLTSRDNTTIEDGGTGDDDEEEEDPMISNLEQDEAEIEAESQRKEIFNFKFDVNFCTLETPSTPMETVEMGQPSQNVLRLLEEDEKVCSFVFILYLS